MTRTGARLNFEPALGEPGCGRGRIRRAEVRDGGRFGETGLRVVCSGIQFSVEGADGRLLTTAQLGYRVAELLLDATKCKVRSRIRRPAGQKGHSEHRQGHLRLLMLSWLGVLVGFRRCTVGRDRRTMVEGGLKGTELTVASTPFERELAFPNPDSTLDVTMLGWPVSRHLGPGALGRVQEVWPRAAEPRIPGVSLLEGHWPLARYLGNVVDGRGRLTFSTCL
ncbi:hypothetical protein I7I51_05281 [Histoplasma capsulatum]|uniref:Uncharacterized protein n=1 Tax=Ajellomyces capsulatus TaxID=5037 RepID=A0A8A1M3A5_AJECA|nr:hypothetical protein I7I51_05281 [Histoplasma capsulatum]